MPIKLTACKSATCMTLLFISHNGPFFSQNEFMNNESRTFGKLKDARDN